MHRCPSDEVAHEAGHLGDLAKRPLKRDPVDTAFEPEMKRIEPIIASPSASAGMDGSIPAQYGWERRLM